MPCLLHYHSDMGPELGIGATGQKECLTLCVHTYSKITLRHSLSARTLEVHLSVNRTVLQNQGTPPLPLKWGLYYCVLGENSITVHFEVILKLVKGYLC